MQAMLGAVPLYHATSDQRVIAYLQRNITTHELNTGKSTVRASDLVKAYEPEKQGPKLEQVYICAFVSAVCIYVFLKATGVI